MLYYFLIFLISSCVSFPQNEEIEKGRTVEKSSIKKDVAFWPHRADYLITLFENKTGEIQDVKGWLTLQITQDNLNWYFKQDSCLLLYGADGSHDQLLHSVQSKEKIDGTEYNFKIKSVNTGQNEVVIEGKAVLNPEKTKGYLTYLSPEQKQVELPTQTYFPLGHLHKLIKEAMQKQFVDETVVFDGSTETFEPVEVSCVIQKSPGIKVAEVPMQHTYIQDLQNTIDDDKKFTFTENDINNRLQGQKEDNTHHHSRIIKIDEKMLQIKQSLEKREAFLMKFSIYPLKSINEEGEYTISQVVTRDGIIRSMVLDYGSFTVKVTLKSLTFFDDNE